MKYAMVKVKVANWRIILSGNRDVTAPMPKPCITREMAPTYDNTIPVWSAANPNCSMAMTET